MQLKELSIKELLALFDASAHEQIAEYYENPEIHHIVVFANHFQSDMGLLTVGPTQDCTSLEQAKRAIIDRKFAKFTVRCRHCPAEKKQPDTVAGGLVRPIDKGATLESVGPVKVPAPVPPAKHAIALPSVGKQSAAPAVAPSLPSSPLPAEKSEEILAREAALMKKEAELKTIEDELKMRESDLVDREEYVMQSEEALIEKIQKQERRAAELEQQEENIRKHREEIARREAALAAKV